jgi:hypothetical protein
MSDETAPKWTLQTGDGALLPEELRAFVDAWLEEAGADPLRALVFAAQDAATLERAARRGLCRGAHWRGRKDPRIGPFVARASTPPRLSASARQSSAEPMRGDSRAYGARISRHAKIER